MRKACRIWCTDCVNTVDTIAATIFTGRVRYLNRTIRWGFSTSPVLSW